MPTNDNAQNTLVTYAVLTGLTPLIPIPFVDDQVYAYFFRTMVQQLAKKHDAALPPEAIKSLTVQRGSGCPLGCVGGLLLYPVKKIFRKIFYFLEWKRAADIISHTYTFGFLVDTALQEGWLTIQSAAEVRAAIDRVLARTDTSVVNRAALGVVRQSKGVLKGAGQMLAKYLPSSTRAPSHDEVAQQVAAVEDQEKQQVSGVAGQLQAAFAGLPAEHFEKLKRELQQELGPATAA